ncbi:hypothetical protein Sjap_005036 [Stephania japonica]|uniref:Uncharacterized protein n=1 Tax=Stephania japonica TaxID=461633 RepID=A0AAP0PHI2_9MAGN
MEPHWGAPPLLAVRRRERRVATLRPAVGTPPAQSVLKGGGGGWRRAGEDSPQGLKRRGAQASPSPSHVVN